MYFMNSLLIGQLKDDETKVQRVQHLPRAIWLVMSELSSNPRLFADKAHALNHCVTLLSV